MNIYILRPSSLSVLVAQPDESHETEQFLFWSGKTDTEHSTTSGSNEEKVFTDFLFIFSMKVLV